MARKINITKSGNTTLLKWWEKQDESDLQQRAYNETCNVDVIKDTENLVISATKDWPQFHFRFDEIDNNGGAANAHEYQEYAATNFFFYQE